MRHRKLAKKIRKEMQLKTSPWRDVVETYMAKGFGKMLLSIFLALFGISASLQYKDWMWFARSGCIISIIGVLLIISTFEEELIGKSRINKLGEPDQHATDEMKREVVALCKKVDLSVFLLGNLIWGFGDLIGKI